MISKEEIEAFVKRTCEEQGIPIKVTDIQAINGIITVLKSNS